MAVFTGSVKRVDRDALSRGNIGFIENPDSAAPIDDGDLRDIGLPHALERGQQVSPGPTKITSPAS